MEEQKGFGLWEVILVLTLLGVMAALALPRFDGQGKYVEGMTEVALWEELGRGARLYYVDLGEYPHWAEELWTRPAGNNRWQGPYAQIPLERDWARYSFDTKGKVVYK